MDDHTDAIAEPLRIAVEYITDRALRLCPPGAATARMVTRDIEVDGYRVEAGTMAVVGIYALHRAAMRCFSAAASSIDTY